MRPRLDVLLAAGCVSALGLMTIETAAADDGSTNTYELSVVASSLETLLQSSSLPVVGISGTVQAATFGASAGLSSLGESVAEAGVPYSPLVASLPGTVVGLVGPGSPNIPQVPGFVSSSFPGRPAQSSSQAGYSIKASSGASSSEGKAGLGVESPGTGNQSAFAHARTVRNDDGSVTALGSTGIDLLNFGDMFDIGNLSTTAKMEISRAGAIVYTGDSHLGSVTFQKLPTGVEGNGIRTVGVGVPVPIRENLATINSLLQQWGVNVRVLDADFFYADGTRSSGEAPDPTKQLKSVITAGLSVALTRDVPTQGIVTVTEILGRAVVSATNRPVGGGAGRLGVGESDPAARDAVPGQVVLTPSLPSTSTSTAVGALPTLTSSAHEVAAIDGAGLDAARLRPASTAAQNPADVGVGRQAGQLNLRSVSVERVPNSAEGPYLTLALGGLLVALSSLLVRFGVARLRFFSS